MTDSPEISRRLAGCAPAAISLPFILVGSGIVLAAANVIPFEPMDMEAPRWVSTALGAVLLFSGVAVIAHQLSRKREKVLSLPIEWQYNCFTITVR